MSRTLRALGATALSLALLVPAASYADHWGGSDPAGDVEGSAWTPEPEPCGTDTQVDGSDVTSNDITRLDVRHSRRAVMITTRLRDIEPDDELFTMMYVRTNRGGWWMDVLRFESRPDRWRVFAFLAKEPVLPDPEDLPDDSCGIGILLPGESCRMGREVDVDRDRVRLSVPRRCLGNPRWVRVGVGASHWTVPEDPAEPEVSYWDAWEGGVELSPWAPDYGPRVRATNLSVAPTLAPMRKTAGAERRVVVRPGGIIVRR